MAPTKKCRPLSWDVRFQPELTRRSRAEGRESSKWNMVLPPPHNKKGVPCAATRTCMRRGALANLRHDVKMPPESVQEIRVSARAQGVHGVIPTRQMIGVPCAATKTCMRRGAMASLRQHVKMPPESVQEKCHPRVCKKFATKQERLS